MNGMATSMPFALKKDTKENTIIPSNTSINNNNDASAIKRVTKKNQYKIQYFFFYILFHSYKKMLNVKLMN